MHHDSYSLAKMCTVYQAELIAIREAVKAANSIFTGSIVQIYCDNLSAVYELQHRTSYHPLVFEIKHLIKSSDNIYVVNWVRAHVGIIGNERADGLAKAAYSLPNPIYSKVSIRTIKGKFRFDSLTAWQSEWSTSTNGRLTYRFFSTILTRMYGPANHSLSPTQIQLFSGHARTGEYFSRFHIQDSVACSCEEESQTIEHIHCHCPTTHHLRPDLIRHMHRLGISWPPELHHFTHQRDCMQKLAVKLAV